MTWKHLSDTTRKARKPHRCYLCGKLIAPNTQYIERRGADDCGIVSARMHIDCEQKSRHWDEMDWETFQTGTMP